jgi:hypothetical protein
MPNYQRRQSTAHRAFQQERLRDRLADRQEKQRPKGEIPDTGPAVGEAWELSRVRRFPNQGGWSIIGLAVLGEMLT